MHRQLLRKNRLSDLKAFLDNYKIEWREGKGKWEIIQIHMDNDTWQSIFKRAKGSSHFTVPDPLIELIKAFLYEDKKNGN